MSSGLRPIIDAAVADAIAEHPKYFTPKGAEHARAAIVRKIMAALRGDTGATTDTAAKPAEPQILTVDPKSREGRAYALLRQIAGAVPAFRMGDGNISIPATAAKPAVYALADAPPQSEWLFINDHRQMAAWQEFFRDALPNVAKRVITVDRDGSTGILMPWPWPAAASGKIYDANETAA